MRYNTFRALIIVGGICLMGTASIFAIRACGSSSEERPSHASGGNTTDAATAPLTMHEPPTTPVLSAPPLASHAADVLAPQASTTALPSSSTAKDKHDTASLPTTPVKIRQVERDILAFAHRGILGNKLKDAYPRNAYKVSMYKDDGATRVNRIKIDFDRDDQWDEKWTISFENGKEQVKKQVAPGDDENYTQEYRLIGDQWERK